MCVPRVQQYESQNRELFEVIRDALRAMGPVNGKPVDDFDFIVVPVDLIAGVAGVAEAVGGTIALVSYKALAGTAAHEIGHLCGLGHPGWTLTRERKPVDPSRQLMGRSRYTHGQWFTRFEWEKVSIQSDR
jgi:hypothetical protein